jgi:co-chaperonin GroES (HSP10)
MPATSKRAARKPELQKTAAPVAPVTSLILPSRGPMLMVHSKDPKQVIYDAVGMTNPGEIPGFRLMANRVLLGIYQRPEKTASGVYITQKQQEEEKYQGKAAMVLMLGRSAFKSDAQFDFGDDKLEVGDWVSLAVSDGRAISINGCPCRVIRDQDVLMKISSPDAVY